MLVPAAAVRGVAMTVVHVIHVVSVAHRFVATLGAVAVRLVRRVLSVSRGDISLALVPVRLVLLVRVTIVQVVGVTAVLDRRVSTRGSVRVRFV
ncbi:MAG: hypothetical protein JOY61_21425 [Chloroflexi bacterium]|nr:hypothetical protein [Chloroflexota bacterium]